LCYVIIDILNCDSMAPKTIFISYARSDAVWLRRLKRHLTPLLSKNQIEIWDDSRLAIGRRWLEPLRHAIQNSCTAILLVSPRYLASDFVTKHELPLFLAAAEERGMAVLWIPITRSTCSRTWISTYQALHDFKKPLSKFSPSGQTRALIKIVEKIVTIVSGHENPLVRESPSDNKSAPLRLFPNLQAGLFDEEDLKTLAQAMHRVEPVPEGENDNKGIAAGYTFLGQFIDVDITFPNLTAEDKNYETPFFDDYAPAFNLHSVYCHGPRVQPFLYQLDGVRMVLGDQTCGNQADQKARQLARLGTEPSGYGGAIIGDGRNDENIIVSQLHAMFLRFHNRIADNLRSKSFAEVQQTVRHHYQWVVIHDFLPTIIGTDVLRGILPHLANNSTLAENPPRFKFYKPTGRIPLEFLLAVYRFGHSMIRRSYRLNTSIEPIPIVSMRTPSLAGFRPWPPEWIVDWELFFEMSGSKAPQWSHKIGTSIIDFLSDILVPGIPGRPENSLAFRALLRGLRTNLPSGQSVSAAMEIDPIPDDLMLVGPATEYHMPRNKPLNAISKRFKNNAPLWYYVLAEAQQQFVNNDTPIRLGPVAGRIVGEVLIGLMFANRNSFLRKDPFFKPHKELCSPSGEFRMAELLKQAMLA
jgi:hypothetical protein